MAKRKGGPKKGVEPAALKAYRLGKKRGKSSGRRASSSGGKKSGGKKKASTVFASAMPQKSPTNAVAALFGVWVATRYKDDGRLVKYIKDDKARYAVMMGAGLGLAGSTFVPVLPDYAKKLAPPVRAFALGFGLGSGMNLAEKVFPKLLPAPKTTAQVAIDKAAKDAKNGVAIQTKMGRLPSPQVEQLREFIKSGEYRMNGRMPVGVMTGRRMVMTGAGRRAVMTGPRSWRYAQPWA